MAQWGAPISEPDDSDRAIDAAVDMIESLRRLNARWLSQGRPRLQVGIGINCGEAFAGYLGSERRLEYTVIGDTVNTAKRLCSAAQGGVILVTESVREHLVKPRNLVPQDAVQVSGRVDPVTVYRVVP
jgi:adenylate cyclase